MRNILLILFAASAAWAQYPIPGSSGGGSGGGGCTAGTGITCVGSTISVDTAVIQSRLTAQAGTSQYCRSTTGNDTYTCALTPTLTAYTTGGCVVLNPDTANTLTATLNVDALGAKSILNRTGGALSTGDIPAKPITLCYDGTNYIIQGDGGGSGGGGTVTDVTCGTGLTGGVINVSGTCAIDTAVVPTKSAANTFAELQTLAKGANISSSTALASAGDIRYNGGDIQYRDGSGSITLMKNPFTTRGDMVIQGASGPTRLAAGTSGYFLMANGAAADPSYQIPNASQVTNAFDKSTGNTISAGVQDFSGTTFRVPSSTTLPATCAVGDSYMDTDATSGQRWYLCESANTWAVQGGSGGGSPGGSGTELQYRSGASTFGGLENSSRPNASQLWLHQANAAASATQAALLVGPTAMSGWNAAGTYFGISAQSGYTGVAIDFRVNNASRFSIESTGKINSANGLVVDAASGVSAGNGATFALKNTAASAAAATKISGSAGTASTNFVAIQNTTGGTATDQIRLNGDQKAVMIGQTVSTTSLSSMSLYVGDTTATTGVTRHSMQEGAGQSTTNGFEYRLTNATPNSGTLVWSIAAGGIPTWGSTTEATCASGTRGQVVMVQGGAGVADTFRICKKDAADAYAWTALY